MTRRRVLVTGGSGFVGSNLARLLVEEGHEVHLLLRSGFRDWRISALLADLRIHEWEPGDASGLRGIVERVRADWIFHLAAYGAYPTQRDEGTAFRTNVELTTQLVQACADVGFEVFVNTGSSSEYGFKDHAPSEDEPAQPVGPYATTKLASTQACRSAATRLGLSIPTLRLYSAYGPYEEPSRLMPVLVLNGLKGTLPPLVSPMVERDFVSVDDIVEAFMTVARQPHRLREPGAIYNVGSGRGVKIEALVRLIRDRFGIAAEPEWGSMPNRDWDTETWIADPSRIRADFDWQARTDLEAGVGHFAAWLGENEAIRAFYEERLAEHSRG